MMRRPALTAAALVACGVLNAYAPQAASQPVPKLRRALVNPLLPSGPDPWVTWRNGFYYYMHTTGNSLTIRKTPRLAELAQAEEKVVWRAPASGPYSRDVWAPELHFLRGKWYIYFSADGGKNASHRIWVMENNAADPLIGEWRMKGKVADASDRWAIDPTVLEEGSRLFLIWSGWEGDGNGTQNLYIAELSDPWTVKGPRVRISAPEYPWEKVGDLKGRRDPEENPGLNLLDPPHVDVNEGPEVLRRGNRIFIVYSAGGCWTDYYSMGMLTAEAGSDLLDPASWKKSPIPVFWQSPKASAYGPGHGSFFKSPDGTEDWMIYHANTESGQGCGKSRAPRAQRFTWKADGMPEFGRPVAVGTALAPPSGEMD
jgi:GH43 family beta-xylosidase